MQMDQKLNNLLNMNRLGKYLCQAALQLLGSLITFESKMAHTDLTWVYLARGENMN